MAMSTDAFWVGHFVSNRAILCRTGLFVSHLAICCRTGLFKGLRPVLEEFVVIMHEGMCKTGSQILN